MTGEQRIRAQRKMLEPTSYVRTYDVDPAGGAGKYTSLKEAYAAVIKDKAQALGAATLTLAQSNPWDWRLVRVAPGTYHEKASGLPPHTALVGQGARPEDVHITFGGNDDTLATTGRSAYVRNVHLEYTGTNPDIHPFRDEGPSGDIGLDGKQIRTVTLDTVRLTARVGGGIGQGATDILPGPGLTLTFVDCSFITRGQPQAINLVTNAHPIAGTASTFTFIGSDVEANFEQHPDPSRHQSMMEAYVVGVPDFGEGRNDRFFWMDGKWSVGSPAKEGRIGSLLAFPLVQDPSDPKRGKPRASTEYILINPGAQAGAELLVTDKTKPVLHEIPGDFNLPAGGTSEAERKFFGSRPSREKTVITPAEPEKGRIKVARGDIYWVQIDLGSRAAYAVQVALGSEAGTKSSVQLNLDKNGRPESAPGGSTAPAAVGAQGTADMQGRWFYPGQGPVWVGMAFTEDAEVPAMTLEKTSAYHSRGMVTTGLIPTPDAGAPLRAGTQVPRPSLVSRWP